MKVRVLVKKDMPVEMAMRFADKLQQLAKEYNVDMDFNIYTDGY